MVSLTATSALEQVCASESPVSSDDEARLERRGQQEERLLPE